jgi:hypothetical protein
MLPKTCTISYAGRSGVERRKGWDSMKFGRFSMGRPAYSPRDWGRLRTGILVVASEAASEG